MTDLVAAAEAVSELVSANADEAEQLRRLPQSTVDALVEAGLMRMAVPAAYGGPEADPLTMLTAIETVARADGAAGWCTMIASTTSSQSLFLPPDTARSIYGDADVVTGGVFVPNGRGVVVDDHVTVTGRWPWGSGTQHCQWILGGTLCDDDTFRLCWFEQSDVTFHDTWHTSGLRGTGSLDFSVDGVAVPLDRTIQPGRSRRTIEIPLARFPNFSLLAAGVASVSLGIARRAIDELVALAEGKRPQFSSKTLAESPYTHVELARAEAALRSARAFLHDEVGRAWDRAVAGERVRSPTASASASPGPTPRSAAPRWPTRRTRSPAGRASTTRASCSAASATPTCRPSTCRWRRSCTRSPAASSSARTSTRPCCRPIRVSGAADAAHRTLRWTGTLGWFSGREQLEGPPSGRRVERRDHEPDLGDARRGVLVDPRPHLGLAADQRDGLDQLGRDHVGHLLGCAPRRA